MILNSLFLSSFAKKWVKCKAILVLLLLFLNAENLANFKNLFIVNLNSNLRHPKCHETIGELKKAIAAGQIYCYNQKRIHTAIKRPRAVFY